VRAGDVIVAVNNAPVKAPSISGADQQAGKTVALLVQRDDAIFIPVTIG
jgi:hypothetical protein